MPSRGYGKSGLAGSMNRGVILERLTYLWLGSGELALGRWRTAEQAFGAEVFIDIGPVNAVTSARAYPMVSLGLCRVK
jgi:hypothetical protein